MNGTQVLEAVACFCGWQSCPNLDQSFETKRDAMARWYDHYVFKQRVVPA